MWYTGKEVIQDDWTKLWKMAALAIFHNFALKDVTQKYSVQNCMTSFVIGLPVFLTQPLPMSALASCPMLHHF